MKKLCILLFFINLLMSCTSFDELVESVINKSSSSIIFFSKSSSVFSYIINNSSFSSYQTSLISSVVYTSFSSSSEGIKIILKNGFEISDGFTNITESDWIRNTSYGIWEAKSIYVNTTSKISGSLGAGLNSNADYLIFPVLSNIGLISFKARANTNTAKYNIYIYYSSDKVNWYLITNLSADGSNNGDIITTSREYLIDANLIGLYYLKLSMSNRNTGVFYIDDIIVFENTNTNIFSSSSSDYSSSFNSISSIGLSSSLSIDNTSSESTSEISSSQWSSISSSEGLRLLINNGFEVVNGFSNISESDWLRTNEEGEWEGKSVYVNSLAKYTGSLGLGMNANNDYIRLPILENPGDLSFYGRTSGLTAQYKILIEKSKDLNNWSLVTNIKADGSNTGEIMTNFNKYEIEIKEIGLWYIRIKMTNRSSGSFYIDEIKVYENTNTNIMSSSSESSENSGESSSQESSISSSEGVKVLIYNGFEIEDGFTNISETNWVRTNKDGEWVGNSIYINATAKYIGSLGLGMNENNDYVRLPVITNAGEIEFWSRTSGLTANYKIIIEKSKDLNNWVIITNLLADGNNSGDLVTNFNKYNIKLEEIGECYFRIKMTNRSGGSFYLDEIKVYENTNTNLVSSSSSEASSIVSSSTMSFTSSSELSSSEESSLVSSSESSEGSTTSSESSSEENSSQWSSNSSSEASISLFSSSLSSEYSSESSSQESSESSISISSSSETSQSSSISSSEDSSIISSYSSLSDESSSSSSSITSSQSSILATNTISIYFRMPNWPDTFTDLKLWYNLNGGNGWSSEYLIASYPISNTWYSKSINVIDPTNEVEIMIQFKANNNIKVLVKDSTFNDQPNGGWVKTNTLTGVISIDAISNYHFNIEGDRFWLEDSQITTEIPNYETPSIPYNYYLNSPPNKTLRFIFKNWNTNQRIYIPGDWNDWDPFNFCFDYSNTSLTNDITNAVILENIIKGNDTNTIEFKILNERGNWNSAWYFDDTWTLSNITRTDFQRQLMVSCIANDLVTVTFDIGNKNISAKSEYIIEDFENYPTGWQLKNGMTETIETTDKVWGNQSVKITGTFVTNGEFYFNTNLLLNSIGRSYISFWMKGLTYTQSLTNKRLVIQAKPTSVCWYLNSSNITNNLIIEHNTNANYIGNTTTLNIWREIKLDLSIFKHTNFFLEFRGPSNFICDILIDRISLVK